MKNVTLTICLLSTLAFASCNKESANQQIIPIPNGDFELWDSWPIPLSWQTNSCPPCVPPFETYIVRKVTDIHNGQFAAKFIFNGVFSSYAINKFSLSLHPTLLSGYIKSTITNGDTAIIHIDLLSGGIIIDSGNWYETSSTSNYTKIDIPISQNSSSVDSATIKIVGGKKQNTELFVDDLILIKN